MTAGMAWGAAILFLLGFEVYALRNGKQTLSASVWRVVARWPIAAFLAGVLCGHFFWQSCSGGGF